MRSRTPYAAVSAEEVPTLGALRRRSMVVEARRIILREREIPTEVYTLFDGWAFRFTVLPDGRRQILSYILPGDLVAHQALHLEPLSFSVQSLTAVKLCVFDSRELGQFICMRPTLCRNMIKVQGNALAELDSRIVDLGRRSALERMARFILDIEIRLRERDLASGDTWDFPIRQEHIADTLGLTPVHVSRTISALRDRRLVSLGHGSITIHDRAALARLAR